MLFSNRSKQDIRNQLISKLQTEAGITDFDNKSVAGQLVNVISENEGNTLKDFQTTLDQMNWKVATGSTLRSIAALVGVYPSVPKAAQTPFYEKNLEWYTSSTFGDINGGNDITIPKGTIVYIDADDSNIGKSTQYETLEDVVLGAALSSKYFSARCLLVGTVGNVAPNTLKKHSFTNYTDLSNKSLKVRNRFAIINGKDTETDDEIRNLIVNAWVANGTQNETTINQILNTYPGIKEFNVIPFYSGLGSTGIIVDPLNRNVSSAWWNLLESQCKPFLSASEIFVIQKPTYLLVDLSLEIEFDSTLLESAKTLLITSIKEYIRTIFHGLKMGQGISLSDLITNIYAFNTAIITITNDSFYNVQITTIDPSDNESVADFTQQSISAAEDQKIILNPRITLVEA